MRKPMNQRMLFFFFTDTATTQIYTLSLHDALPICNARRARTRKAKPGPSRHRESRLVDRKSTRLNSSHPSISYAVFCLKKKNFIDVFKITADTHSHR